MTGTERGSVTEAGRENLTDESTTVTETEIGTGTETASVDGIDLAAESENVGKNAPGTGTEIEIGIRTGREIENDETGVEAERGERTGKTINMIHPEMVTVTKSNGFMHLHMLNICM